MDLEIQKIKRETNLLITLRRQAEKVNEDELRQVTHSFIYIYIRYKYIRY